jgi:hypothetical protein
VVQKNNVFQYLGCDFWFIKLKMQTNQI